MNNISFWNLNKNIFENTKNDRELKLGINQYVSFLCIIIIPILIIIKLDFTNYLLCQKNC